MTTFLAFTIVGLVVGCIYAMTATGLVVTYTTSGVFNFAHGAIGMLAAFTYWQLTVPWGWPVPLAFLFVLLVLAPLLGALIERVLIRPLHGAPVDLSLVVTLGLLLASIGIANQLWRPTVGRVVPKFFQGHSIRLSGVAISYHQLLVIAVAVAVAVFIRLVFTKTRAGIAMRAVVDNPGLLARNGAAPGRIQTLSWAIGASLASLAGILLAPLVTLNVLLLTLLVINGYAAAAVGRLKSLPLTVAGALTLGLAVTYGVGYIPTGSTLSHIQAVIPMVFLFIVLIVLPQERLRVGTPGGRPAPPVPSMRQTLIVAAALIAGTAVVSVFLSPGNLSIAGRGFATGFILLSLVLLTGYGGLVSLCQMTFVGLGAYAMGHLGHGGSLVGLFAAIGLAGAAGALVAFPTLKLRGLYLALATLAFAQAMDIIFFNQYLGQGLSGGSTPVDRLHLPGLSMGSDRAFVILLAVAFAVVGVGMIAVRRGRYGRRLASLNDSPAACATLGLNINLTKLVVFAAAAALAGIGGVFFGGLRGRVSPNDFVMLNSLVLLLLLRIGGVNTVSGAFFGGMAYALFPLIQQHLPSLPSLTYMMTGIGAIFLARDPNGMGGRLARAGEQLRARLHERKSRSQEAPIEVAEEREEEERALVHS
jgi:branched-chain amino acid transport system permease protein